MRQHADALAGSLFYNYWPQQGDDDDATPVAAWKAG
jgi:hypothetical protein